MSSNNGLEIIESCLACEFRADRLFCDLSASALETLDALKYTNLYPKGAVLFAEGQSPRGIFVLCRGRAKLSTVLSNDKTRIMQIGDEGEVLGLSATLSGRPYEATAETLCQSQVNFIKRDDFLRFLANYPEVCLRVAHQVSNNYQAAFEQVRLLALAQPAAERLARLLLEWCEEGEQTDQGVRLRLNLTQEEIAQVIGTSRETVTRLLGEFKHRNVIHTKGSTMLICDKSALGEVARR
ncbi:MAG TPA: Crp/Fnr family transcriptional regulator [Blastocatellia bacterium]|nr:Crp/Fnr family transcriptional regulator [Blastocatellia bacterium]